MTERHMRAAAIGLVILAILMAYVLTISFVAHQYKDPTPEATGATEAAQEIRIIKAAANEPPKPTEETPETFATAPTTEATTAPTEVTEPETEPTTEPENLIPDYAAEMIGRTIWGEAQGVESRAERAAVAWCILNRADAWGLTIREVVTAPNQFHGYRYHGECPEQFISEARDVLARWQNEKHGFNNVGRTLPAEYLYFYGDGERNHFTQEWKSRETWDWSLPDPYQ